MNNIIKTTSAIALAFAYCTGGTVSNAQTFPSQTFRDAGSHQPFHIVYTTVDKFEGYDVGDRTKADARCATQANKYYALKCLSARALVCYNTINTKTGLADNNANLATNFEIDDSLEVWGIQGPRGTVVPPVPVNSATTKPLTDSLWSFFTGYPEKFAQLKNSLHNSVILNNNPIWTGCDDVGQAITGSNCGNWQTDGAGMKGFPLERSSGWQTGPSQSGCREAAREFLCLCEGSLATQSPTTSAPTTPPTAAPPKGPGTIYNVTASTSLVVEADLVAACSGATSATSDLGVSASTICNAPIPLKCSSTVNLASRSVPSTLEIRGGPNNALIATNWANFLAGNLVQSMKSAGIVSFADGASNSKVFDVHASHCHANGTLGTTCAASDFHVGDITSTGSSALHIGGNLRALRKCTGGATQTLLCLCLNTPTNAPTTNPTKQPTQKTQAPGVFSSKAPTTRTYRPTKAPAPSTQEPTFAPTRTPTLAPLLNGATHSPVTDMPTSFLPPLPTKSPTTKAPVPTTSPTKAPTKAPTKSPTKAPTTKTPTASPTKSPTTSAPTTKTPTASPTKSPTTSKPTSPFACGSTTPRTIFVMVDLSASMDMFKVTTEIRSYLLRIHELVSANPSSQIGVGVFNSNRISMVIQPGVYTEEAFQLAMNNLFSSNLIEVSGFTPTVEALTLATSVITQFGVNGHSHHVLFITDGEPNPMVAVGSTPLTSVSGTPNVRRIYDLFENNWQSRKSLTVCNNQPGPARTDCTRTTLSNYLFKLLPNQANSLKTGISGRPVKLSFLLVPDAQGRSPAANLISGLPEPNLKFCRGQPSYSTSAYCRWLFEGFCACGTPQVISSTPVADHVKTSILEVEAMLSATKNLICPT